MGDHTEFIRRLSEETDITRDKLIMEADLRAIGWDSFASVVTLTLIDNIYHINLPIELLEQQKSLADLIALIESQTQE